MKIRNGFVSNSSSSSFIILKESITDKQKDMIINNQDWIKFFINLEKEEGKIELKEKFEYYDTDPWNIIEDNDYIFGETLMDNFSMNDYLDYIKIDKNYIFWDDGYNSEPYQSQLDFIKKVKQEIRGKKLIKINKSNKK